MKFISEKYQQVFTESIETLKNEQDIAREDIRKKIIELLEQNWRECQVSMTFSNAETGEVREVEIRGLLSPDAPKMPKTSTVNGPEQAASHHEMLDSWVASLTDEQWMAFEPISAYFFQRKPIEELL